MRLARVALLAFSVLGLVHCKGGGEAAGPATALTLTAAPARIRPDGMPSALWVAARDADRRLTSADVLLRASCGTIAGVDAPTGSTVAVRGNTRSVAYACDPHLSPCCVDGLAVTVSATAGPLETTATVTLDQDATGGGGPGGVGPGGGTGGDDDFAFDVAPFSSEEVAAWDAAGVAHLDAMAEPMIGFTAVAPGPWIGAGGEIVYVDRAASRATLRVMVPDRWVKVSGAWAYPARPSDDDPALSTAACGPAGVAQVLPKQGGGDYLYACATGDGTRPWYDSGGTERAPDGVEPLSWNANGDLLVAGEGTLSVVTADGDTVPVGLASNLGVRPRAHGDGFWIVDRASPAHLWAIHADGTMTDEGALAPPPAAYTATSDLGLLDGEGAVFAVMERRENGVRQATAVVRRPRAPAAAEVAYEEPAALPGFDGTTTPPRTRVRITPPTTFHLLTGP